ncbi:helicase dna-binding protein [Vairimorpha apis BRL 01]|uniref:Helicase dna-binding protein n=1 Tax=Vairimorpha apis BRL 01 TaxID=1037528 RepID=T0MJA7_9MICR|nr:helicase dna-binding protein [Vairimorpha apis BRL 01]
MTRCLDLLSDYLSYKKYKFERIDGGVRGDHRQAAIDRFSDKDSDGSFFCYVHAQVVCHRIGQKNEVKIYRLVTRNTYEREMFDKAGMKLGLDRAVLQKMSFEGQKNEKVKKKDAIEILLRKGAYGVLMETDEASKKFCEEDIDQILERRTKVIKHSDGGNVFSKASFQVEEEIDDPYFWDNLLNKKRNEENEGRVKRQMRRLARDDVITSEEIIELEKNISPLIDTENDVEFFENQCLKIFTIILKEGISKLGLKFNGSKLVENEETNIYNLKDSLLHFKFLFKFLIDQLPNPKLVADFSYCMDQVLEENYDPSLFEKYKDLYSKFGEKFLLRAQIVFILNFYYKQKN